MKKTLLLLVIVLLFTNVSLFAQDQNQQDRQNQAESEKSQNNNQAIFLLNFTNFGMGTHMPYNDGKYGFEMNFELIKFGVELKGSNIGFEFSPCKFYAWPYDDYYYDYYDDDYYYGGYEEAYFSFINFHIHWNVLGSMDSNFFLAPFASISYLFLGEDFYFEKYVLTAGLQSGIRGGDNIKYNIFTVETGFRILEGVPKFYAGVKFDFIMHLLRNNTNTLFPNQKP